MNDVLTWSDQTYRMFGAPIGSPLTYNAFLDFVHPEDREHVNQKWTAALGREPYDIEHRIIVDDEVKWVHEKADLEFDDNGELLGGIGTVQDITERKKDEHALREAAEKYKVFVQESIALAWSFEYRPPMPLDLTLDEQIEWTLYKTHLVECNESFAHAYGFSSSNEALGVTVRGIFGDDEELAVKQARDWIEAGHEYHVFETFQQTRTGEYKWYLNTASSVIEDNCLTKGWGTALDVTEIKKSQEALRKRDRDIRKAYSDVFSAVTDGKLVMLTQDEILEALGKPVAGEYSVPSAEKLAESRQYLREILAENLPTGADVGDLILASGETVTNGVKHAGSCDVQVFMLDGSIQIKVSDEGSGIAFSDLPKAAFMAGFSTKKSLGMGFTVILEVCDRVLLSTGKEGTTVVLEAGGEKEEESLDDILARTHVG